RFLLDLAGEFLLDHGGRRFSGTETREAHLPGDPARGTFLCVGNARRGDADSETAFDALGLSGSDFDVHGIKITGGGSRRPEGAMLPGSGVMLPASCESRESNPDGLPHRILSPARLPVPPLSRMWKLVIDYNLHNAGRNTTSPSRGGLCPELSPSCGTTLGERADTIGSRIEYL